MNQVDEIEGLLNDDNAMNNNINNNDDNFLNDNEINTEEYLKPLIQLSSTELCKVIETIYQQMQQLLDKYKERNNDPNDLTVALIEQKLQVLADKMEQMKEASNPDIQSIMQLVQDTKLIILESIQLQQVIQQDEFTSGLHLDYNEPKRIKEIKSAQERKQERKRARLLKSKQAFSQFKKFLIYLLVSLQRFIRNPENIAKLFVIAVTCFFISSFLQIPDMSNRHQLYLLEWLAYNRSSRVVLISGSLCLVSLTWYMVFLIWIACVGMVESKGKLQTLLNDCNPLLQITLIFMTDNDLINNKFDLAVWFCYLVQFATFKVYHLHSMTIIKKLLANLSSNNIQKIYIMHKISVFTLIILALNATITTVGILMLHRVGFYALSLLFFGGITTFVEYTKTYLVCKQLLKKYSYFINSNIDQLNEPQFYHELIPDCIYHILKICYCSLLIINYFRTINFQIFLHLWLFYVFSDLQASISEFKKCVDQYIRLRRMQQNIDESFPRTDVIEADEICSICHDELLIARQLPCQHRFHLKCLFNWLKAQQQCPICRADVPIVMDEPQFVLGRIFNLLTSINISNITIFLQAGNRPMQQQQQQ